MRFDVRFQRTHPRYRLGTGYRMTVPKCSTVSRLVAWNKEARCCVSCSRQNKDNQTPLLAQRHVGLRIFCDTSDRCSLLFSWSEPKRARLPLRTCGAHQAIKAKMFPMNHCSMYANRTSRVNWRKVCTLSILLGALRAEWQRWDVSWTVNTRAS